MQVTKVNRRCKCNGYQNCQDMAIFWIKFNNKKVNLCEKCAERLQRELNKQIVPKGIKSKFS